jgi:DNA-binding CsgD family transcriptional regulator
MLARVGENAGARACLTYPLPTHDRSLAGVPPLRSFALVTLVERAQTPTTPLTAREREVLARIAAGMTSKEIASALGVALRTVNTHREHLAKKLSTSSVAALVRYAIENDITVD